MGVTEHTIQPMTPCNAGENGRDETQDETRCCVYVEDNE